MSGKPPPVDTMVTDLAWSLWRELGVPGPLRRHQGWLVVPEPLIVFTAWLGDRDRRLRDHAVAWCLAHASLISTRAVRNTFTEQGWGVGAMADFSATVKALGGPGWPGVDIGAPFTVGAEHETAPRPFLAPEQLALRLRALLGVGVRAEVLRVLLLSGDASHTLAQLSTQAMATKRQTTDAVEQLSWSGIVTLDRARQPYRVRLARPEALAELVGPLPAVGADLAPLLRLVAGLSQELEEAEALPEPLATAQLHRALRHRDHQLSQLAMDLPPGEPAETFGERTRHWSTALLEDLAAGRTPFARHRAR